MHLGVSFGEVAAFPQTIGIMRTSTIARFAILSCALFLGTSSNAQAQGKISLGPQVTTMGFGLGLTVNATDRVGISAEYNYYPIQEITDSDLGGTLRYDPDLQGGLLMVTLRPFGDKFGVGAGVQVGGASATGELELNAGDLLELGDSEYTVDQLESFTADFKFGHLKPAFMLGWMGKGFNFGLGIALASPELELDATGLIAQQPEFQADLQAEVDKFNDDMGSVPVYPLLRIGWQFGF